MPCLKFGVISFQASTWHISMKLPENIFNIKIFTQVCESTFYKYGHQNYNNMAVNASLTFWSK